ncbi:hypothetical protein [Marispirochaeta aestuarii]|uniref:hypothetical protein n=1 Tax=Marispirochaeta aestuarii TaxID=1963862 RepID=UPI0029C64B80|nr:hypothetical protein [Marispirochaeta aestuarii]
MKPERLLGAVCVSLLLSLQAVVPQVQIIRQPPPSGEEAGSATWRNPYSDPVQVRESGRVDLSGRISVGGKGGRDQSGDTLYDFTTDSMVTLIQPLGGDALLSFDAAALRVQSAVKEDQKYDGTLALDLERFQLKTSGGFSQSLSTAEDLSTEDSDARFSAAVSSGLLETMPMSLEYQSVWVNRQDEGIETESSRSDELGFKTVGTIGTLGVDLRGNLDYENDREEMTESLATVGKLTVSVPVQEQLAVLVSLSPLYNRSETDSSDLRSTSMESGLGINWAPREFFDTTLKASRVDAWSSGEGVDYEDYQNSWRSGVGLNYLPPEGWFAGPEYTFTKAEGGNLSHDLLLLLGWHGREELTEISGNSSSSFIRSENGDRVKDTIDWQLKAALMPTERMNLDGEYQGGYIWQVEGETWNQEVELDFRHSPDPGLSYRSSAALSSIREEDEPAQWEQQYAAGLSVKPLINFIEYRVDASETVDVSSDSTGDDILSSALMKVAFPLNQALSGRVGFQWEWINRVSIDGDPGNYYHYTTGLSLAGKGAPVSLTADYGIAHGYRGLRQDISSGVKVPLRGGYSLNGDFTLSSYEEDDEDKLYWVFSLNLVYDF